MNHIEEYNAIIEAAIARDSYSKNWNIGTNDNGYVEVHHIIPKCQGGDNSKSNLVVLTAQEHYHCHRLLALVNPLDTKLQYAWWLMCQDTLGRDYEVDADEYAVAKIRVATLISNSHKGKITSDDTKVKMSASMKGNTHNRGRVHTDEARANIKLARQNPSDEVRVKISASMKGKPKSKQARVNMSIAKTKYKIQIDDSPIMNTRELIEYAKEKLGCGWKMALSKSSKITMYGDFLDNTQLIEALNGKRNKDKWTHIESLPI